MALSTVASWASSAALTVGGMAVSSVVENLVDKVYIYLRDRMLPVECEAELQRLQRNHPMIAAVMDVAEALKMKHPDAGPWVEQFRQALEALEDVLDELEYKKLEDMVKKCDEAGVESASCSKKQKSHPVSDDTLERLREAVRMLDQAAADVVSLLELAKALEVRSLSESQQEVSKNLDRETSSSLTNEVFGREEDVKKITNWLKQPDQSWLSSFGIIGVGGLGKTTLAQLAYQEMRVSNYFDKIIWVCVSTSFTVERITRNLLSELGESSLDDKPLNALQKCLMEKISSKKILFILDDVWDDKKREAWEKLFAPLRCAKEGSKILFTTRMESVAKLLASVINTKQEYLYLERLGKQQLRLLLNSYAFRGSNPDNHSDLEEIGDQIVEMLQGSPLAAKVIGGLLNSKLEFDHWSRILNHGSLFNIDEAKNEIEILKLSYYHLPTHLQVCFRFCSIFHEDYLFDKKELIEMWIASGFVRQRSSSQKERLEDIGEDYFNQLLGKSFFEIPRNLSYEQKYLMHDLIHELARIVSTGECCRVVPNDKPIPKTVRHISIDKNEINKVSHLENLRTLIITSSDLIIYSDHPFVLPNSLIMKNLRVIKISQSHGCKLPEEIGCLMHLRYLSFRLEKYTQSSFNSLPTSIYMLYHLQVLEIHSGHLLDTSKPKIIVTPQK